MQKDITQEAELEWFECLPFKEKVLVRVQVFSIIGKAQIIL